MCVGLGLSCRAWTTSVSLHKWLVKQLVLAKLSIMIPALVSCQYLVFVSQLWTVSEVSLCVAVWSLSFKKIIYLASESLTQVCCQYLGVPRHRTLLLDMAGYLWTDVSACALVDATSEQFKQKILQQHQNRSVDRRCAPTEQTNMNRHVRNPLRGHKEPKIGWGISGIPLHWRKSSWITCRTKWLQGLQVNVSRSYSYLKNLKSLLISMLFEKTESM